MEISSPDSSSLCVAKRYVGSPDLQNNVVTKQQPMSSTLRERLKRTRRSFTCPVVKQLKIECDESEGSKRCASNVPGKCGEPSEKESILSAVAHDHTQGGNLPNSQDRTSVDCLQQTFAKESSSLYQEMIQERRWLLKQVEKKEDILRRLKMVKLYRSKNNLSELQSLIEKWRKSSQIILYELQNALSTENSKISLSQLIDNCGLDDKLLLYNRAEEDFETV